MPRLFTLLKDVHQMVALQGMARLHALAKEYAANPTTVVMDSAVHSVEITIKGRCMFYAIKQLPSQVWTVKAAEEILPFVRGSLQGTIKQPKKEQNARFASCV